MIKIRPKQREPEIGLKYETICTVPGIYRFVKPYKEQDLVRLIVIRMREGNFQVLHWNGETLYDVSGSKLYASNDFAFMPVPEILTIGE